MFSRLLLSLFCLFFLNACSGYRLGSAKPSKLSSIQSIHVPLAENDTQEQRVAALVTNTVVDTITRDGTYKIGDDSSADASLEVTITRIRYREYRADRLDTLRASEVTVYVESKWQLVAPDGKVLMSAKDRGDSRFFVADNQQTSRQNAFPDAAKDLAEQIVSRIANGF